MGVENTAVLAKSGFWQESEILLSGKWVFLPKTAKFGALRNHDFSIFPGFFYKDGFDDISDADMVKRPQTRRLDQMPKSRMTQIVTPLFGYFPSLITFERHKKKL